MRRSSAVFNSARRDADLEGLLKDLAAKGVALPSTNIQSPVFRMAICLGSEGDKIVLHQLKRKARPGAAPAGA